MDEEFRVILHLQETQGTLSVLLALYGLFHFVFPYFPIRFMQKDSLPISTKNHENQCGDLGLKA